MSITNELTNMQNATAVNKNNQQKANGPSQELDQDAFLMLMLEQMKQQDPLNPMDNSQMLAQQAQFTQISEMQKLNSAINSNNMIQQANGLVGKTVQIVDPDNTSKFITGVVTSANFTGNQATVTVNGKEYPLGLVAAVTDGSPPTNTEALKDKKLGDLNNASITEGAVTLTVTDENGKKKNTVIDIKKDMTLADLQKKIEEAGIKTSIKDGVLTMEKGNNKTISMTNGNVENPKVAGSNLVGAMKMYCDPKTGNLETGILDFDRSKK